MPNDERNLETMPDGALGLIPLESCKELGLKVLVYLKTSTLSAGAKRDSTSTRTTLRSRAIAEILISSQPQCRVSEPAKQRVSSKSLSAAMTCI